MMYRLGYVRIRRQNLPIDYWDEGIRFLEVIDQFKNNMTVVDCVPFNISYINRKIYSKATIHNKTLYIGIVQIFLDIFKYDFI